MEFSRDRKSMSVYCTPSGRALRSQESNAKLFVKGAPEGILERCKFVRVGKETVEMTNQIKKGILENVTAYGTGKDTLRCLALATVDSPVPASDMKLTDSKNFVKYEVSTSTLLQFKDYLQLLVIIFYTVLNLIRFKNKGITIYLLMF